MQVRTSNRQSRRRPGLSRIERDCLAVLRQLGVDPSAELDVSIVGPSEMRRLNRTYRGINKSTDVLSFPLQDLRGRLPYRPPKGAHTFLLGDVVIDAERAAAQAREAGHTITREYRVLLVHGILHLLGFGHEEGGRTAGRMRRLEQELLASLEQS